MRGVFALTRARERDFRERTLLNPARAKLPHVLKLSWAVWQRDSCLFRRVQNAFSLILPQTIAIPQRYNSQTVSDRLWENHCCHRRRLRPQLQYSTVQDVVQTLLAWSRSVASTCMSVMEDIPSTTYHPCCQCTLPLSLLVTVGHFSREGCSHPKTGSRIDDHCTDIGRAR